MTQKPNLGTTWKEAVESAYAHGYNAFQHSVAGLVKEARRIKREEDEDMAIDYLMNNAHGGAFISESQANKRLWWAIDDFYKEHMSDEEYEQLQREAAVAEDLDSAFRAGAYDAILDNEYDKSCVSHMHDGGE